jgi:threonine dehydrogenase-like Zn-dependent dehydrogenase
VRFRGADSRAIVFTGPGQVELRQERLSRPGRGQALLDARCSLVSTGTERRCFERDFAPGSHWDAWVKYPFRPGYSFVGVTESGERVCAEAPHSQKAIVATESLIPIPDGVNDEDASWFTLAAIAQNGLAKAGQVEGNPVVVVGAGVLGQLVAQLARAAGASKVIVIARSRPRLDVAAALGATHVLAEDVAEAAKEVLALTDGGAAVVFDVTGSEPVFADALKLARRGGTVVLLGDAGDPSKQRLGPELLLADLHVVGAHLANAGIVAKRRMADEFFAAVQEGVIAVHDLITARARPEDAAALYASLSTEDAGRLGVLFEWRPA